MISTIFYLLLAILYIQFSGNWAAQRAETVEELKNMEVFKGQLFVIITGIVFFLISLSWWRITQKQRQLLIASERRAVAALYSATLAHDLNNMLTVLGGLLHDLKDETLQESTKQFTNHIQVSLDSLSSLSKRIAGSVRTQEDLTWSAVDLKTEINRILCLARSHPSLRQVQIHTTDIESAEISLPLDLFEQMLLNLLLNAGQAMPDGGIIRIRLDNKRAGIQLTVQDDGPGIPEEKLQTIFRAGYSTKPGGCGIGLLTVQAFTTAVGGTLSAENVPDGGAVFNVSIPKS